MASRLRVVLIVLLGATAASAFSAALAYQAESAVAKYPVNAWRLLWLNGSFWYGWVLLAWPLVALSRRVSIGRSTRVAIPVLTLAVAVAAVIHVALQTTAQTFARWYWIVRPGTDPDLAESFTWLGAWGRFFPQQLASIIDWEIVTGAAVVGIAHAAFYYVDTQRRAVREAQLEARLLNAQLQMLQQQLHPHFLFNTLNAISALMHRDVRTADRVLVELGDLLRLTLDSIARPEIRLGEEVEFLEKYLHIEQVRLGDRLTVEFDVAPDTLDAVVPALILQPLVENAVKHGIAPQSTPGRIRVSARRHGEMLLLSVDDTGPGPSERAMAAMSTGIGVSNTRARLSHQFGSRFRFEFQRHDTGFTALVGIPFRRDPAGSVAAFVA